MKYTSAEANKLLRKLNSDYNNLIYTEREGCTFLAATGEDIEAVRPAYDYAKTKAELDALAKKIRTVKHALNVFNTTTVVEGFDMTIDEMLVFLPQLSGRVDILNVMGRSLPKMREKTYGSGTNGTIDYRYVNYDLGVVANDYNEAYELLSRAQTALDTVNNTVQFDIDL